MAEATTDSECTAAALPSPGGSPQPAPSATQQPAQPTPKPQSQKKKKSKAEARRVKNNSLQADGAVSDSVVNPMANQQSKQAQKPRQQSVALPSQAVQSAKANVQKQRPVSVGGNMLPATPAKEQAYAGPTFQASPAASALPMPKFFSKSVPNVAKHSASLDARMASQKTPERESSPEPDVVSPQPPRSAQQSPLDLFFNAQKAENQQKASMQSPETKARQMPPATEPRNPFQQTGKSIFLRELDGDSDAMPSPKTVPPNNYDRDAYTQSLKDLLFNGTNANKPQNATTPPQTHRPSSNHLQSPEEQFFTPSPTQRSTSGPSTPTPTNDQSNNYSLHYGNRNLSPLFKAARGETPPRPSNLRQHSSASDNSPVRAQQYPQRPATGNSNDFHRNYLDQHLRASQPATMPQLPGMGTNGFPPPPHQQPYQYQYQSPPLHQSRNSSVQHGVPAPSTGAPPRTTSNANGNGRDIRSMEDDLRRMLKVNVLGN